MALLIRPPLKPPPKRPKKSPLNGKTAAQYKEEMMLELGGSVVDIEIEDDLEKFVDLALNRIRPVISESHYMTVPTSDSIDLSDKDVYAVVQVFRGAPNANSLLSAEATDDSYLFNSSIITSADGTGILGNTVDTAIINYMASDIVRQIQGKSSDVDFEFDDGILYVDTTDLACTKLTIEYIPSFANVEDVKDPFWQQLIYRLALAKAKVALGRARVKYRLTNLPYEIDGDTLVAEGQQEQSEIEAWLTENNDTNYFID